MTIQACVCVCVCVHARYIKDENKKGSTKKKTVIYT